ncbi:hypothetical protein T11_10377 [Trichinella zimbabwensis]|uniref:CCHC-type domain-containing protein n=1 Tax=Trichinella zimbabwensis TaxID=268475 RepID=A0A0V1GTL5_9BILA|nr:hypothetical protein T11_10377 [Trichinella zimbabwensis]
MRRDRLPPATPPEQRSVTGISTPNRGSANRQSATQPRERGSSRWDEVCCWNCGQPGHWRRDCPSFQQTGTVGRANYPAQVRVEALRPPQRTHLIEEADPEPAGAGTTEDPSLNY